MKADDNWREVQNLGEGIFLVRYHKLSVKALKSLRSRLLGEVIRARRELAELYDKVEAKRALILEKEQMLDKLTEDKISEFIDFEKQQQKAILEKANSFLREYIGENAFQELQQKGSLVFQGLDGKTYRIKRDGELQQGGGKFWYDMCTIKPSTLPLPDIIASVFTAASKSSESLKGSRLTKTSEEVKA